MKDPQKCQIRRERKSGKKRRKEKEENKRKTRMKPSTKEGGKKINRCVMCQRIVITLVTLSGDMSSIAKCTVVYSFFFIFINNSVI